MSLFVELQLSQMEQSTLRQIRDAEERQRTLPPRCLENFRMRLSELSGDAFTSHRDPFSKVYQLDCSACRHDQFWPLGQASRVGGLATLAGPLALECCNCGRIAELFDIAQHGLRAELGLHPALEPAGGERSLFACDRCGPQPLTAHTRFEHASEIVENITGEFTGNEQDLFTWFSLIGRCDGCERLLHVADFECA